jgi:hypothetical protein
MQPLEQSLTPGCQLYFLGLHMRFLRLDSVKLRQNKNSKSQDRLLSNDEILYFKVILTSVASLPC